MSLFEVLPSQREADKTSNANGGIVLTYEKQKKKTGKKQKKKALNHKYPDVIMNLRSVSPKTG